MATRGLQQQRSLAQAPAPRVWTDDFDEMGREGEREREQEEARGEWMHVPPPPPPPWLAHPLPRFRSNVANVAAPDECEECARQGRLLVLLLRPYLLLSAPPLPRAHPRPLCRNGGPTLRLGLVKALLSCLALAHALTHVWCGRSVEGWSARPMTPGSQRQGWS